MIGPSRRRAPPTRSLLAALALSLTAAAAHAAPCGGPSGLYAGAARQSDGTVLEITLNLICEADRYKARFFTPAGDFDGGDAGFAAGHFTAKIDTGVALGAIDLTPQGDKLSGAFVLGGDKGVLELTRTGDALGADAMTPRLDLTPAQWRADLADFAAELPKLHANAFATLSKGAFDAEVAALDARAGAANGDEMFVGLQRIAKSIGDGHTGVTAPADDRRVMPIEVTRFGGDLRITAVGPGLDKALGARIVKIGGLPIGEVWTRVLTLTARNELPELRDGDALVYLARGYALHGLGVIADRNHALYTLQDDAGRVFDVDVQGLAAHQDAKMKSGYPDTALRLRNPDAPFWCENLAADHAVYCAWRSYQDLEAKARVMFALIDAARPAKLIIDMRDNGGGDNTVGYAQIVRPIEARADLDARGRLFVLVGPLTFSAAMNNAAQFQDETKAILVGQRIGERPNSYQEPRQFRLPNSHLIVRVSTLWYAFRKTGPNEVAPEKEIVPTWDDARHGRDPVLDWVLARMSD
jgi:Peptidase family S41